MPGYHKLGDSYHQQQWEEEVNIQQNRILTDEVTQRNPNYDSRKRLIETFGSDKSLSEFSMSQVSSIKFKPDTTIESIRPGGLFEQEEFL
jgi:hypothetical protein